MEICKKLQRKVDEALETVARLPQILIISQVNVDRLERQKRIPLRVGVLGSLNPETKDIDWMPNYQIPPRGYDPETATAIVTGGVLMNRQDRSLKLSTTLPLTEEEAEVLERRIAIAQDKLQGRNGT